MRYLCLILPAVFALCTFAPAAEKPPKYPWLDRPDEANALERRIPVPDGYQRTKLDSGTFGRWLRNLPLKPGKPDVSLYNGRPKPNQNAHVAVINLDVGSRDLQQCADSIIRLRAEYLWSVDRTDAIAFSFTSGDRCEFAKWAQGYRPSIRNNRVSWAKTAKADASYGSFRSYLNTVFTYAGTLSLSRDLHAIMPVAYIEPGDVFIRGGSPGHAVIVVDIATHPKAGKPIFLLAQGYMPAQEMHILKNPKNDRLSPWYPADFGETLETPEWTFRATDRKRFRSE